MLKSPFAAESHTPFHQARGGRVVKTDRGAGSYAPSERRLLGGISVMALGMALFAAPTALPTWMTGGEGIALAADECGAANPGDTIVCDGATYDPADGDIQYRLDGLDLTLDGITITSTGRNEQGARVRADLGSVNDVSVTSNGTTITTGDPANIGLSSTIDTGRNSDGIRAEQRGTGTATAVADASSITTYGHNAVGVYAWQRNNNPGNASLVTAELTGGSTVETSGSFSHGLYGRTDTGLGDVEVTATGSTITTNGPDASGIRGLNLGNEAGAGGNVTIDASDMTVRVLGTSNGNQSVGIMGENYSATGSVTINVANTEIETTSLGTDFTRRQGHAVYAIAGGSGDAIITSDNGTYSTQGDAAHGVFAIAQNDGAATVELAGGGSVTTNGADAFGGFARAEGAGLARTEQSGNGTISTSGDNAFGLTAEASGSGEAIAIQSGDGTIQTLNDSTPGIIGSGSAAVQARGEGSANATAQQSGAGLISTAGVAADGVIAFTVGQGDALAEQTGAGTITLQSEGSSGVVARAVDEGNATAVQSGAGVITASGISGAGVYAETDFGGDANATQSGDEASITINGVGGYGVRAQSLASTAGAAVATQTGAGEINTSAERAVGITAFTRSVSGNAVASQQGSGTVTTTGQEAYAVYAWSDANAPLASGGNAIAEQSGDGEISTTGDLAHGLFALTQTDGDASALQSGAGTIETTGDSAAGVFAQAEGSGNATANATGGGTISTTGTRAGGEAGAHGVFALAEGAGAASSDISGGTTISTTGDDSEGVFALSTGSGGSATITFADSTVTTSGANGEGLVAQIDNQGQGGIAEITMTSGSVTTSGDGGAGVLVQSAIVPGETNANGDSVTNLTIGADAVVMTSGNTPTDPSALPVSNSPDALQLVNVVEVPQALNNVTFLPDADNPEISLNADVSGTAMASGTGASALSAAGVVLLPTTAVPAAGANPIGGAVDIDIAIQQGAVLQASGQGGMGIKVDAISIWSGNSFFGPENWNCTPNSPFDFRDQCGGTGRADIEVAIDGDVSGGWGSTSDDSIAAGLRINELADSNGISVTVGTNGTLGALSDVAFDISGNGFNDRNIEPGVQPLISGDFGYESDALVLDNQGEINGSGFFGYNSIQSTDALEHIAGNGGTDGSTEADRTNAINVVGFVDATTPVERGDTLNNQAGATINVSRFADSDGDGTRDTEYVGVIDFDNVVNNESVILDTGGGSLAGVPGGGLSRASALASTTSSPVASSLTRSTGTTLEVQPGEPDNALKDSNDLFVNDGTLALTTVIGATTTVTETGGLNPDNADFVSTAQYVPQGSLPGIDATVYDISREGVEQAHIRDLETFEHSGVITMQDLQTGGTEAVAGDVLVITGNDLIGDITDENDTTDTPLGGGAGTFVSNGGSLYIDTLLNEGGAASQSDVLVVDQVTLGTGATQIFVEQVAGSRGVSTDANDNGVIDEGEGILVVEVLGGAAASDENAFTLGGTVINSGVEYFLNWGSVGGDWYLANVAASDEVLICGGSATVTDTDVTDVLGCIQDDIITIDGSSTVAGLLQGAGGSDTISILGDASITGVVNGAGPGQDDSADADTGDIILVDTTGTVGSIDGALGDDTITLANGTVTGDILGGVGDDTISVSGGSVGRWIRAGEGEDTINFTGGNVVLNIDGGAGNDAITIDGGTAGRNVFGAAGDDVISLLSGSVANNVAADTPGDGGNDTVILDGADVVNFISSSDGEDNIQLLSGSVGGVRAGPDDDIVNLDGATVARDLFGGAGDDIISLTSGSVGTIVFAGQDDDVITLNGATISEAVQGGDGDDRFDWTSGVTPNFNGGTGSDTATVSATEYDGSQLLDGGDDTSVADGWIDGLTLQGLTVTANSDAIVNWETLTLDGTQFTTGDGALTVGSDEGTGLFLTNGSTLDAEAAFALTGNMNLGAGTVFLAEGAGAGAYSVSGSVNNAGLIDMADGTTGDTLSIGGNYAGTGTLALDFDAATDSADTVAIAGSVTGGTTLIDGNNVTSGLSTGNDIVLVSVDGTTVEGDFALAGGPFQEGAYQYDLVLDNSDWLLRAGLNAATPTLNSYLDVLRGMNQVPTLQQRVGNRHYANRGQAAPVRGDSSNGMRGISPGEEHIQQSGLWGRVNVDREWMTPANATAAYDSNTNRFEFQLGADFALSDDDGDDTFIAGINAHYITSNTDIDSSIGGGDIDTQGYGLGATLTWYDQQGFYADAQGRYTWYESDLDSDVLGNLVNNNDADGYVLSLELGQKLQLDQGEDGQGTSGSGDSVTPQVQLIYSDVSFDEFGNLNGGGVINQLDGESLRLRAGLAIDGQRSWKNDDGKTNRRHIYGIVNLHHEFLDPGAVVFANTPLAAYNANWFGEFGLGGSFSANDGAIDVFAEFNVTTNLDGGDVGDFMNQGVMAGIRINW
ncbi:autotransporter outer membrane beta-barrel domain-containing protein [Alterisphingorhabdus coralli]|uniref:Autotransporter outer membrane beta-barrel domain-containing protein n=1 Tax=Alterisphingorhabdus coralli TaxID=3071408 RepID=A0AA97F8W5_9SPHN|nr:autotransporter outer membrane beta-barrel domain-containing protein [Parasphingorhabdus sp. SCSIO 66989]WOE76123.1 autotransporter outer membrane beta-barrel domain-containing protein [Parasphingorhabdus sp. SCSIO 66989]